jgi:vacuolar-type H+-ATPase subunit I/STV1
MPNAGAMFGEQLRQEELVRQRAAEVRRQQRQTTEEAVQEIQELRKEIETLAARLQERAHAFRVRARRVLDEESNSHIVFANAHLRFSGAILQGLRRTTAIDRVLRVNEAEREEVRRRELLEAQRQRVHDHGRLVDRLQLPTDDPMAELYGEILEGEVTHVQ